MCALEPGLFWKSFWALKKFLFDVLAIGSPIVVVGAKFRTNPSKYGCFSACAGVIRFYGSKVIIFIIRSIACSDAFGINCASEVGTNFGNVKPILEASW